MSDPLRAASHSDSIARFNQVDPSSVKSVKSESAEANPRELVEESKAEQLNQSAAKSNSIFRPFLNLFSKNKTSEVKAGATDSKVESKSEKFHWIKAGKAKNVYIVKGEQATGVESKNVYYSPVRGVVESILGRKKNEIKGEVVTAKDIKGDLEKKMGEKETYIAADLAEVTGTGNLAGKYVVQAPKAGDGGKQIDLDALLSEKDIPFAERLELGTHIIKGVKNLHDTGRVHGDLKGDNILHFRELQPGGEYKSVLRLADFGKTKVLGERGSVIHTGNPRFADSGGKTTMPSETYSVALLLVRLQEEFILRQGGG